MITWLRWHTKKLLSEPYHCMFWEFKSDIIEYFRLRNVWDK